MILNSELSYFNKMSNIYFLGSFRSTSFIFNALGIMEEEFQVSLENPVSINEAPKLQLSTINNRKPSDVSIYRK